MRKSVVTYVESSRSKEQLFDRWCHSQRVDENRDRLMTAV